MTQALGSKVVPLQAGGERAPTCAFSSTRSLSISLLPLSSQFLLALLPPELRAILQAMENELPPPHTSSSASVTSSTSGVSSSSGGGNSSNSGGSGRPAGPQISVYSGIPDRQTVQVRHHLGSHLRAGKKTCWQRLGGQPGC